MKKFHLVNCYDAQINSVAVTDTLEEAQAKMRADFLAQIKRYKDEDEMKEIIEAIDADADTDSYDCSISDYGAYTDLSDDECVWTILPIDV